MARKLSIQDFTKLANICGWWHLGDIDCFGNRKFPGNKSGGSKPGKESENGIEAPSKSPSEGETSGAF